MAKETIAWVTKYVMGQGWLARVRHEKMNITAIRNEIRETYSNYDLPESEQDYTIEELAQYVWQRAWGK